MAAADGMETNVPLSAGERAGLNSWLFFLDRAFGGAAGTADLCDGRIGEVSRDEIGLLEAEMVSEKEGRSESRVEDFGISCSAEAEFAASLQDPF
jgi:hypothetical protein